MQLLHTTVITSRVCVSFLYLVEYSNGVKLSLYVTLVVDVVLWYLLYECVSLCEMMMSNLKGYLFALWYGLYICPQL